MSPKAKESLDKFKAFAAIANDQGWDDYIDQGSLNLTLIASSCGISRSVIYQNTHVMVAVSKVANVLLESKAIERLPYSTPKEKKKHKEQANSVSNKEIDELRKENQALNTRVAELKAKIEHQQKLLDQMDINHELLYTSGRLPR
ncbi:MAG: hypothetical protein ACTH4J_16690 [Vibrio toranzoniae]|jgi:predicted RNase H-like nuclease (RuvC/YqgF family)|uniref:hypothetical protein n=1 Tax=Vibrio toranzoniae TaxID=1194427 RepID=UPI003F963F8D